MNDDATNYTPRTYQDDLDGKNEDVDPVIDEETDDPVETFGIPPEEFKQELDGLDIDDDTIEGNEDMREMIEDRDEDGDEGRA